MSMKKIDITINEDGGVEVEAFGFHGKGCGQEIDIFAKALGEKIEVKNKGEFFVGEPERIKVGWKK